MKHLRDGLLLGGICLVMTTFAEPALAHGGQYVGPGDVVGPPPPGGGRGRTGQPARPTTGSPAGPVAPGASGPTTPGSGPTTGGARGPAAGSTAARTGGGGIQLDDDLTRWVYWWEFNKNPYIKLKDSVHRSTVVTGSDDFYLGPGRKHDASNTLEPTEAQIMSEVLPALKRALDDTLERDFDIISSCLVALAKIGKETADLQLVDVFKQRLSASNQEIRETAALSLGIAGLLDRSQEQVELLIALAHDSKLGRQVSAQAEVNERTRAFAAYGLGLAAHSTTKLAIKKDIFAALATLLESKADSGRNLSVAAIHGISLLNLRADNAAEKQLLDDALDTLKAYYELPLGPGSQMLQAHCPTAIAKLIGPGHLRAPEFKSLFADGLRRKDGKARRSSRDLQRSCALALGKLCIPDDPFAARLVFSYRNAKDAQTRYFSVLALGQIGGTKTRETLLNLFDKSKTMQRPWCALALGVQAFHSYERSPTASVDTIIGATLFDALKSTGSPEVRSALAVALGLAKYSDAADYMRRLMTESTHQAELAGYLCIGLALMNDTASKGEIMQVVYDSARQPDLLKQAAVALGKLGDKEAATTLSTMLAESDNNLAKLAAISSALGFIGDRRSIPSLRAMLLNTSMAQLPRAFAAVALGGVADKERMPWNSKIGVDSNYRASTETLTNQGSGILDIL